MNSEHPRVTVVLPTYNRANTIMKAVDSVLHQTYEDYEFLIVDDGSSDNTRELISGINDSRIRYIKSPVNRGASFARNSGIRAAKGELIAFQDSDDEWLPDKLRLQVEAIDESGEEYGLVYTRFFYERPEGNLEWPPLDFPLDRKEGDVFQYMLLYNPVGGPTMMIRRECIQKVGMFNTELRSMEDYELALRVAKYYKIKLVNELLVKANDTPGSLSKQIMAHVQAGCLMIKIYKEDYIRYHVLERKLEELRKLAGRILPEEKIEQMIALVLQ